MKIMKRWTVGFAVICGVFGALSIRAQGDEASVADRGWYVDSGVGVNFLTERRANPGFRLNVAGGYNFNRWVGLEGELGFLYNSFKSGSSADYNAQVPLLLNCVVRYENETKWVPYAGIGLGIGALFNDHDAAIDPTVFQLKLGVRRAINENMSVGLGYRFLGSGVGEILNDIFDEQFGRNHSVTLEFSWKF